MRGRRRTPRLRAPRPRLLGRVASASVSAGANVSSVISSEADRHPVGDSQQRSLCLPGISSGIGHGLEFPVESATARDSFCESRPPGHRGGLRGSPSGAPPGQWGLGRKTRRPSVALSVTHTGKCRGGGWVPGSEGETPTGPRGAAVDEERGWSLDSGSSCLPGPCLRPEALQGPQVAAGAAGMSGAWPSGLWVGLGGWG